MLAEANAAYRSLRAAEAVEPLSPVPGSLSRPCRCPRVPGRRAVEPRPVAGRARRSQPRHRARRPLREGVHPGRPRLRRARAMGRRTGAFSRRRSTWTRGISMPGTSPAAPSTTPTASSAPSRPSSRPCERVRSRVASTKIWDWPRMPSGQFDAAEKSLRKAVDLARGAWRPYLAYGAFLFRQGRAAESLPVLRQALALATRRRRRPLRIGPRAVSRKQSWPKPRRSSSPRCPPTSAVFTT